MYRATKEWQLNRYINLLVKQGILYFVANFLLNFVNLLGDTGKKQVTGQQEVLTNIFEFVPVFTLTPRFIMSIRELYADDVQGRRRGLTDTGFGLSTLSDYDVVGTGITFAKGVQNEVVVNSEADAGKEAENIEEMVCSQHSQC
ncbi:hypothetical protein JVU11DRAFT_8535 [Chiua virens]|nr:hypothetical protein JVU11DRAFT_8535 [Chiua virens]